MNESHDIRRTEENGVFITEAIETRNSFFASLNL